MFRFKVCFNLDINKTKLYPIGCGTYSGNKPKCGESISEFNFFPGFASALEFWGSDLFVLEFFLFFLSRGIPRSNLLKTDLWPKLVHSIKINCLKIKTAHIDFWNGAKVVFFPLQKCWLIISEDITIFLPPENNKLKTKAEILHGLYSGRNLAKYFCSQRPLWSTKIWE